MRFETQGAAGRWREKCKIENQQDWVLMTYGGRKHQKEMKDQNLDDSKEEGQKGDWVCQMLSFQLFGNDKRVVWAQTEARE